MKRRVFVDTGVFIAAWQGRTPLASRALALIENPELELCTSSLTELELLPQAKYHQNEAEAEFYRLCLSRAVHRVKVDEALVALASARACLYGLHAMDALHVAVALTTDAEEIVTTERIEKPLHRLRRPTVTRLV